jgi:hypothetical protein
VNQVAHYITSNTDVSFFSQPTTSQQIHPQNALIYASQPQNSIPIRNPVQLQNVEQNSKKNLTEKDRNLDDQANLTPKS